jgi:hypothetical protein
MAMNRLAGSGPTPMSGGGDGPSPGLSGTLGVAPQASPQPPQNMLSQGGQPAPDGMPGMPPQGAQGQMAPPSKQALYEVSHKQTDIIGHLRELLAKPDLKTKDILSAVGEIVADGTLSPFDAAKYLSDLPTVDAEPLQLRQWVAQHYANAAKNLGIVDQMIAAHGQMVRRQAAGVPPQMPFPRADSANQFSGAQ